MVAHARMRVVGIRSGGVGGRETRARVGRDARARVGRGRGDDPTARDGERVGGDDGGVSDRPQGEGSGAIGGRRGVFVNAESSGAYGEAARRGRASESEGFRSAGRSSGAAGRGRGRGRGLGASSSASAKELRTSSYVKLNQRLASFEDVDELLDCVTEHLEDFNVVNLSTSMHKLGKLNSTRQKADGATKGATKYPDVLQDPRFLALTAKLREYLTATQDGKMLGGSRGAFKVRELSAIVWGAAHCGMTTNSGDPTLGMLFKRLIALEDDSPPAQNVSNLLWAYASMHNSRATNHELLRKLEYWCDLAMDEFVPQGISNSLWAFASLGHQLRPQLVTKFSNAIRRNITEFKSMEFSNVIWALGTMKIDLDPPELLDEILDECLASLKERPNMWSSQSVSNNLWAMASLSRQMRPRHDEFLAATMSFLERRTNSFILQGLSNAMWAYATLGCNPPVKMLENVTERFGNLIVPSTSVSECCILLWSYGSLRYHPGNDVLNKVAVLYLRSSEEAPLTAISNSLWAWANFDWLPSNPEIMRSALSLATRHFRTFPELQTQSLSNILWSLAILRYVPEDEEFLRAFSERSLIELREGNFASQGLTNTVWAFSVLGINPGQKLLDEFAREIGSRLPSFNASQGVSNSLFAFSVLEYWPEKWVVDAYRAKLVDMHKTTGFSELDWSQLFQANVVFERYSPHGPLITDPEMLARAEAAWKVGSGKVVISQFHREVSETLTDMGVPHEIEKVTEDGLFSLDIALKGKRVAIEVDGPSHFARNVRDRRLEGIGTGVMNMRTRCLMSNNWTVVHVPWYEWADQPPGRRTAFMAKILYDEAGLTVMDVASDEDMSDSGLSGLKSRSDANSSISVAQIGSRIVIESVGIETDPQMDALDARERSLAKKPANPVSIKRVGYGMMDAVDPTRPPTTTSPPRAPRARARRASPPRARTSNDDDDTNPADAALADPSSSRVPRRGAGPARRKRLPPSP